MIDVEKISNYLKKLQKQIIKNFEQIDGKTTFKEDSWNYENGSGGGLTCVIENGGIFEKGGVNFSHIKANKLPDAILKTKPELEGYSFEAMGVSIVMHSHNPYVPTSHMNVRFFIAENQNDKTKKPIWWFGGGYDLTPFYGFKEDCIFWHQTIKNACDPFGLELYPKYKKQCDEYFYLPHRGETRGIGGIFFDYLNNNFEQNFAFLQAVGESYQKAYLPIVEKRKDMPYSEKQKHFQLYRRGRYVEFNLVYDKGTHFGLQSNGRTESILMSLPPEVHFIYNFKPKEHSKEKELTDYYLVARNWLAV